MLQITARGILTEYKEANTHQFTNQTTAKPNETLTAFAQL